MASKKSCFTLNLGSQSVGFAEFQSTQDGGLILLNFQRQEMIADPALDAVRNVQIAEALEKFRGQNKKMRPSGAFALPSQSVFARFVKLPAVTADRVDQIIGFEAQQNVPFPIDEVVWDYQLVGSADQGSEVEVVLVAIKSDLLDDLNDLIVGAGYHPKVIDVASMALYNAFRYNYGDVTGCSLLVDMGARTTNLIFVEGNRIFSRSLPIGGSTITGAIAKEFGSSFADAEGRKQRDGFVSLGGAYADPDDPDVAMVSKLIRNTMTRLHAEIGRSIQFYKANQGGGDIRRCYLSGGNCNLPYMKEFFQEKLQIPIEYFNPLRNVKVDGGLNIEEVVKSAHLMGELVGLALRVTNSCPVELNLRPAKVVREEKLASKRPVLVAAACCLVAALLTGWFYFKSAAKAQSEFLEKLQGKVAQMQVADAAIKRVNREIEALEIQATPLALAVQNRQFWAEIINELNAKLPPRYIWVTALEPTSGGRPVPLGGGGAGGTGSGPANPTAPSSGPGVVIDGIRVRGLYLFNEERKEAVIVDFVSNLAGSKVFNVDPSNQADVISRSTSMNVTEWAFDYELRLNLKTPIILR